MAAPQDSAHGKAGSPPGLPKSPSQSRVARSREGSPADSAAAAPAAAQGGAAEQGSAHGGSDRELLPRKSGWDFGKNVLTAVRAAGRFSTLRDLYGTEAYIDPSRLDLLKALGEGAFAKVQHAKLAPAEGSSGPVREVAVKTLRKELLEDPDQIQHFIKEVALLRKLRHKHILEFIGCSWQRSSLDGGDSSVKAGWTPKQLFYVQEYCAGGSLGDLVRRQMVNPFRKLYSDADALRWSLHIALALQYLHEARPVVIHRDLKLENVIATHDNVSRADAKLADFGLARLQLPADRQKMDRLTKLLSQPRTACDPTTRRSSKNLDAMLDRMLTKSSTSRSLSKQASRRSDVSGPPSILSSGRTFAEVSSRQLTGKTGSFGYMSPEVSREQQYDAKADVFSLSMCMYDLFCRTIPTIQILLCGDESALELYAAKVAQGYRPPLPDSLPPSVAAVIEACWKGDPDLRPTAGKVVEMLQAIQASGDCKALPDGGDAPAGGGCCSVM